jgi:hypothetical protein
LEGPPRGPEIQLKRVTRQDEKLKSPGPADVHSRRFEVAWQGELERRAPVRVGSGP